MTELFLINGRFHTQDPSYPHATAVAIRDGRLWAVGGDEEIRGLAGAGRQVIDLEGRLVLPGMTDAHVHFYDWSLGLRQLPLAAATSLDDVRARVARRAGEIPPGGWILGQGWNETRWPDPRMPTRVDLDAAAPDHPVILWRNDLHLASVNSRALELGSVTGDTPDPPEGIIDRDEAGRPTGVLRDLAINLVSDVIPPATEDETIEAMRDGFAVLHQLGLTGVHDYRIMGGADGPPAFRALQRLQAAVEHVQNIRPDDVARLARLNVVASVQPLHVIDDLPMTDISVGERARFSYPFRDMWDAGVTLALGSDCPVSDPNPLWGIHAAVTRQQRDGTPAGGWYPKQRLTVAEAVWGFTMGTAVVSGREGSLGSITPGKLADLAVLDRNIFAIDPMEIHQAQVVMTIFDGRVVYER